MADDAASAEPLAPLPPNQAPIQLITTDQGPRVGPYIFGKTLGTGSTGKVKLAKNLDTDEIVAIKIVRKDYLENKPSLKKKMRREISVLKVLSHPNLMSLIDVFEIETHLFLVMEFVDGLELFEYLVRRGALPLTEALTFFQQIICGLEYCHRRLICHRDLKPENLLLDRNFNIKIADFGMTSLNPPGKLLETSCGSPHYCDPMVVSGEAYDGLKADIWSCGVILYAMVTGRLPFDDDNIQRLLQKVQRGQYHLPSDLPKDLRDLIKSMLTVDPELRITLEEIKKHPWFKSIIPRNWVEDNFVAPTEPILRPDMMVVRSLIDLGWGDAAYITAELAKEGESMEKVFYTQLEQHPMFHRSTVAKPSPQPQTGEDPTSSVKETSKDGTTSTNEVPAIPINGQSTKQMGDAGASAEAVPPVVGASKLTVSSETQLQKVGNEGTAATEEEAIQVGLAAVSVQDGSTEAKAQESEATEGGDKRGGPLVRQSSRFGLNVESSVPTESNDDDVINSVSASNQKGWFDSLKNIITGQHEDGRSAGESRNEAEGS